MSLAFGVVPIGDQTPPSMVEEIDYSKLYQRQLEKYSELDTEFEDSSEFEPVRAHLGADAHAEMLVRQRINQASRANRLATAEKADLDVWGWERRTPRLVKRAGDPDAVPPVPVEMEADDDYRHRIWLAPAAWSVAGPGDAYEYWARSVPGLLDVWADSPSPCLIDIWIAPLDLSAPASVDLLSAVYEACAAKTIRPIGDRVTVRPATIIEYSRTAVLKISNGPGQAEMLEAALASWQQMLANRSRIGIDVPLSVQYAALSVPGVEWVDLQAAGDVAVGPTEIARCTTLSLSAEVING